VFALALLLLYAIELFLSPDPTWTMWRRRWRWHSVRPDAAALQGIAPARSCGPCQQSSVGKFSGGSTSGAASQDVMKTRHAYRSLTAEEIEATL